MLGSTMSRRWISLGALAVAFGTSSLAVSTLPASAQLARPQSAIQLGGDRDLATTVQFRGRGGWHGGYRGWRGGYRGGWGGRYYGPGIGLGLGLATGALIGGALASPYYYSPYYAPAPQVYYGAPAGDAVAYCMQRFRSYDPSSGTYLGYDGQRHPCP
jgi:BA14K-like protein